MPSSLSRMPVRALPRRTLPLIAALCAVVAVSGCDKGNTDDAASSIVRTTTAVAGADIVGIDRDTRTACPAQAPADPADGSTRTVRGVNGDTTVPADPQRIVVLSTQALDTACQLGLWEKVIGATTPDNGSQPSYLGDGIAKIPGVGSLTAPDPAKIKALAPDLILGTQPFDNDTNSRLSAIAPTVFDGVGGGWQQDFLAGATTLGRGTAGQDSLDRYHTEAQETGANLQSAQTQASLVRFGADSITVRGSDTFAAQVLSDAGVRRPQDQRDGSFPLSPDHLQKAEGDLIYVSFDGDKGKAHATSVMKSSDWEDLGASGDHRVWVVDDQIWSGNGVVAARSLLADLRSSLNNYAG